MQGYILSMRRTKGEDMIVRVLTPTYIKTLYRFYGARHSIINLGHKIDFEEELQLSFMPKLKNLLHLGHRWEKQRHRFYIWQSFIKLLDKHLSDVLEIDEFYFSLLNQGALAFEAQNPKRVALEMYASILNFEGRANVTENKCFACGENLEAKVALGRAFLFAHQQCIGGKSFPLAQILNFLHTQNTILFEDEQIDELWEILNLGL